MQVGLADIVVLAVCTAITLAVSITQNLILQQQGLGLGQNVISGQNRQQLCHIFHCTVIVAGDIEAQAHEVAQNVIHQNLSIFVEVCQHQFLECQDCIGIGSQQLADGIGPLLHIRGSHGSAVGGRSLAVGRL